MPSRNAEYPSNAQLFQASSPKNRPLDSTKTLKFTRRRFLHLAAGAAALPAVSRLARAQAYPTRPIRVLVTAGPGSAVDVIPRVVFDQLSSQLRPKHGAALLSEFHGPPNRTCPERMSPLLGTFQGMVG
jgi:hypothetical protein